MALVSMRELLDHAAVHGYGIPAFNVNNLEQVQAVMAAADAVGAAIDLPFEEGLKKEREGFLKLMNGEQSKAQRYAFFAEREAAKISGVPEGTKGRNVARVAILGAPDHGRQACIP
jgi:fructose/tagatose bisphosphate aldolase